MAVNNLPDPVLITRPAALMDLVEILHKEPIVAVDTESNSLYAYREQVCLIQFSTPETDYLVDPLVLKDLSSLGPVFANQEIEKVFHAAEYDLICLKRDYGFHFANLFDTMLAARILGREAFGLGAILEAEFGIHLDKRFQRANWGQRPLPPHLLAYARLDTRFLIPLQRRLKSELEQAGLLPLAEEDFQRLGQINGNGRVVDDKLADCWRISGASDLDPQEAAILVELCRYRDRVARAQNRPLFKVINDRTLTAIAAETPQSLEELRRIQGMTHGQVERHGFQILEAVQRGLQAPPIHPPRPPRPNEQFLERMEQLRRWRKQAAEEMGVKSDVILPRDLLIALAESHPSEPDELAEVLGQTPWRMEHFGGQILEVLSNTEREAKI